MPKKSDDNPHKRRDNLLFLLEQNRDRGISKKEIIKKIYEVRSEATSDALRKKFDRDLEILEEAYPGAIWKNDDDDLYRISDGFYFMRPLAIHRTEAVAMTTGVSLIPHFVPSFKEAAKTLWGQMQKQIPENFLSECQYLSRAIISAIPIAKKVDAHILETILKALSNKKILNVAQYRKAWPDDPERCRFSPWTLYLKYHSWYILGELHEKDGSRTSILRVDRIRLANVLDDNQPHPCGGKALEELENDIRLDYNPFDKNLPKDGYHVKLRVTGSFVQACQETKWFPGESCTPTNDGSGDIIYEVTLKGLEAITLWIMRALNCIEVLEPVKLREIIDERVDEYLVRRKAHETKKVGKD